MKYEGTAKSRDKKVILQMQSWRLNLKKKYMRNGKISAVYRGLYVPFHLKIAQFCEKLEGSEKYESHWWLHHHQTFGYDHD